MSITVLETRYVEHLRHQPVTENEQRRKHPGMALMITGGGMMVGGGALFLHSLSMKYGGSMAMLGALSTATGLGLLIAGACVADAHSDDELVLWRNGNTTIRVADEGVGVACSF